MKFVASIIGLLLISAAIWAYSMAWRVDRTEIDEPVVSPSGLYVAQQYVLPEISERPYGYGVYIRYRFIPPWIASTDVFAAYCGKNDRLYWSQRMELTINCETSVGAVFPFTPPNGIRVKHVSGRS